MSEELEICVFDDEVGLKVSDIITKAVTTFENARETFLADIEHHELCSKELSKGVKLLDNAVARAALLALTKDTNIKSTSQRKAISYALEFQVGTKLAESTSLTDEFSSEITLKKRYESLQQFNNSVIED